MHSHAGIFRILISPMKTKNILLVITLLGLTTVVFIIFSGSQQTSLQTIVSETHKRINDLKLFKENLRGSEEKRLNSEEKYLVRLGFHEKPNLYPNAVWTNTSLPVIVTYVKSIGDEIQAVGLLRSVQHFLPNTTVLVYNLGVSQHSLQTIQGYCEGSHCILMPFDLSVFPSHTEEQISHAYRPLIIQDALNRAGAVLFLENDHRLTSGQLEPLFLSVSTSGGIIAWATRQATSSLTHPNMFDYFHTTVENFLFLPMVEARKLLIFNTADVHYSIMFPWVQCALTEDCIFPIGAQSSGCHFNKKPQYRYSGCHGYDTSALNIVLGLHFDFDVFKYTLHSVDSKKIESFFKVVNSSDAFVEFDSLEGNINNVTGFR